jgi:hypothetical protein
VSFAALDRLRAKLDITVQTGRLKPKRVNPSLSE